MTDEKKPDPIGVPNLSLAELAAIGPEKVDRSRNNRQLESFARSEHYQPVVQALQRAMDAMLRQMEQHVGSGQHVTWYAAAHQGLNGFKSYLRRHEPK